jgi:hypothetical protein
VALQWNKSWKEIGQKTQAQTLRHRGNETTRQQQKKANLQQVKMHLQIKTARFKLSEGARKNIATKFRVQTQAIPRRGDAQTRRATSQSNKLATQEFNYQVNRGKAGELAKLINKPKADAAKQVAENTRSQPARTDGKQTVPQPQMARVPDRAKKTKAPKKLRGQVKAKIKAQGKVKAQKIAKQVKPGVKVPDAKQAAHAGTAAAAAASKVKGHTGKQDETKLEKKGKESSLTENVGKTQASRLKKLSEGSGSAQADVNVNVGAKDPEWQPSESDALAAKETKSSYEFGKDEIVTSYNEPGPIDDVRKQAKVLNHKVLQPKVANAARVNERVTEQLEKIALSKKIDTDDPELKELFSRCRISSGGPYGGMHA